VGDEVTAPGVDGAMELRVEETEERRVTVVRLFKPAAHAAEAAHVAD
jgi:hypothetical protein